MQVKRKGIGNTGWCNLQCVPISILFLLSPHASTIAGARLFPHMKIRARGFPDSGNSGNRDFQRAVLRGVGVFPNKRDATLWLHYV
jgi:hypothetical protein